MTIGIPAHFTESRAYKFQPHQLVMTTKSAFEDLEWNYEEAEHNLFSVDIAANPGSWGEKMTIEIYSNGLIKVDSECIYPLQIFDWGKNKRNVHSFFSKLELMMRIELTG